MGAEQKTLLHVGTLDLFMKQIGRVVEWNGEQIAVFRDSEDRLYALENRSPHPKGGPLAEGIVSGHYLYDPLYDWKIDLTTGQVQAPDTGQVKTYSVKIEDGNVWLGT
ncbi:nitrite reductase small subunit NirD [Paenibacillus lentus]|uniref:nitrite reductase small subunit NirD n=1 Tax=Paenibacillus lentus TaxID=1338368 RepID=UPI0036549B6C